MRFRPQLKVLVCGVGMALAAGSAIAGPWGSPAQGETGQGVDTVQANGFNPRGLDPSLERSADGMGPFRSPASHTPTGQMYSIPWAAPEEKSMSGSVEFGLLYGGSDNDAAKLKEYRDFESGFVLNYFHFGAAGDNNRFFDVFGGGVGRDDQYYAGTFGVYNDFKIKGFYNETPHVFTTTARPLWNGINTGYLALKQPLQFTGTPTAVSVGTNQNVQNVVNTTPDTEIALIRKKGGLRFDKTFTDSWSVYSAYTLEKREGGRTWGGTGGGFPLAALSNVLAPLPLSNAGGRGQPVQMVEPIDYKSHEFTIGSAWTNLGWADAVNVSFSASIFKNDIKQLIWENPFAEPTLTFNAHVQQFVLPPDNEAYYGKFDYTKALPNFWNGVFNATLQYGRQTQDEDLLPFTTATGTLPGTGTPIANTTPPGVVCANCNNAAYWNAIIAPNGIQTLSQLTADRRVDSKLADLNLSLAPTDRLTLRAKYRFNETDNKSSHYSNCNPALTAETFGLTAAQAIARCENEDGPAIYGFPREDAVASNVGIVPNVSSDTHFRALPYDTRSETFGFGGGYQLTSLTSITANYEHEEVTRKFRERDETQEHKLKLGMVNRKLGNGTLRTSYEYDDRDGDDYKTDAYYEDVSLLEPNTINQIAANGVLVSANIRAIGPPAGQKHDINDRKQHILIARYNYMFTNTLDGMVTAKRAILLYPEPVGRDTRTEDNLSLELNYQPTTATTAYAFYTWQTADQSQVNVGGSNVGLCSGLTVEQCNTNLGAPNSVYQTASTTRYETKDNNHVFGVGLTQMFDKVKFDGQYQFTKTRSEVSWTDVGGALNLNGQINGTITDGLTLVFPDMEYDRHTLNLSATVPINDCSSVRFLYMFEKADVADWHYDGLATYSQSPGARYYLDAGPAQSYKNHAIGAFWQYKM